MATLIPIGVDASTGQEKILASGDSLQGILSSLQQGTGIEIDITTPSSPIVGLDSTTQADLMLAQTSVQDLYGLGISATSAEIDYVIGVTSPIQAQIDAKFALPALTAGSVLFSDGTTIAQDNANFFWDDTANVLEVNNVDSLLGYQMEGVTILTTHATSNSLAVGRNAGVSLASDGNRNTLVGSFNGRYLTTGDFNTAIGYLSLSGNSTDMVTGNGNTALGYNVLSGMTSGTFNVGVGYNAATAITTGNYNFAMGPEALNAITTTSQNIGVGRRAGYTATGTSNIFFGYLAGDNQTSGDNNLILGSNIDSPDATGSNLLNIKNIIFGTGTTGTGTTIAGNIGIGLASPTARLHLPAGTATASSAPLKLTTGTALTTPEDGAMEYHGSHLYFTIGSTRYQLDQQGGGVSSVSGTSNRITSTGGATPVIDIAATYVGQSSITTLGTIGTGTWQGTAIADTYISSAATWNAKQSAITFGTGVQTALGVNIGSAGAPVLFNGALGTPSSGTLTNATGTATGLTSGITQALKSATTAVDVSAATAPSAGQVLTATSSTAATWQAPSGGGTVLTSMPRPVANTVSASTQTANVNTTMYVGMINLPVAITANSISLNISSVGVAGTLDITLYSEDGQSQLFSVTTANIAGGGVVTTALSAVSISAGNYYIAINTNGTADIIFSTYTTQTTLRSGVTSEPVLAGTVTITAGTPPATITPSTVTDANPCPFVRFDN